MIVRVATCAPAKAAFRAVMGNIVSIILDVSVQPVPVDTGQSGIFYCFRTRGSFMKFLMQPLAFSSVMFGLLQTYFTTRSI